MKRTLCILLVCVLALGPLTGCGALAPFERSYSSVTTHQEQSASDEDASILRAENYTDLVSCVQHYVSMGQESGTVHVYKYSGDIDSDLDQACSEVLTEDPLGAYALADIDYEYSRIVSYYECTFTFSYRRTLEDMASIVDVYGNGAIRELIETQLSAFSSSLTIRTSSFYADRSALYALVQEAYYASPGTAMGYPEVSISIYPDSGSERIIELSFDYSLSQETLVQQAEEVAATAALIVGQDTAADSTVAWLLCSRLLQQTEYDPDGSASVYSALCQGQADSEGIALAYELLCDLAGIDCALVSGTLDGQPHSWDLITVGEISWHVDLTRSDPEGSFLHNDSTMTAAGYSWSQEDWPVCDGEESTDDADGADAVSEDETGSGSQTSVEPDEEEGQPLPDDAPADSGTEG